MVSGSGRTGAPEVLARRRTAQVQFVGVVPRRLEAKGPGERLGACQVGFVELQPGDVGDLDHRIAGPARVLAAQRAFVAVQIPVGVFRQVHRHLQGN
jgi:hypothetical protein